MPISNDHHQKAIEQKVHELDGNLIDYKRAWSGDPFKWYEHGKNITIMKFTYEKDGLIHTGWVKFTAIRTVWRIDEDD